MLAPLRVKRVKFYEFKYIKKHGKFIIILVLHVHWYTTCEFYVDEIKRMMIWFSNYYILCHNIFRALERDGSH